MSTDARRGLCSLVVLACLVAVAPLSISGGWEPWPTLGVVVAITAVVFLLGEVMARR